MANSSELSRLMWKFGKRLRDLRVVAGYKNAEAFASDLGIDGWRYRKYERSDAWPPLDVLVRIAELTSCKLDFLLLGKK
jgi:transcriptional regulator with XRE-family HTH domain